MNWLVLCGLFSLICVTSSNVLRTEEEVVRRIKRESPNGGSCSMADLVFVLDSSGSLQRNNWNKVLTFVKGIVSKLSIGPLDSHVGVVSYGSSATLGFHLNKYQKKQDIINAVMALPWKDEETNTSGGIWFMREKMFNINRGDRGGAPNIGIVVTDGESNRDKSKTIPYANEAKMAGITMIAVGVGAQVNQSELRGIASNLTYVYSVDNFKALKAIEEKIVGAACDVPVTCPANPDVVFLLDASGSVREKNFVKMKDFVNGVVDNLNVDTDFVANVGLMAFSNNAHVVFHLNKFNTRFDIKQAVSATRYWRGTTNTAEALRQVRTQMFLQRLGDRPVRPNIVVLFTDGGSNDFDKTLKEAMAARQAGITIIVVAVSDWVNLNEVKEVASDPDVTNVIRVVNFNQIETVKNQVVELLCNGNFECLSNPCANSGTCVEGIKSYKCICPKGFAGLRCQYKCDAADVVFALDTSASLGKRNFYKVLDFTKNIISHLNIDGNDRSRVGLETFSDQVSVKFHLNAYSTDEDVRSAISYPYKGVRTNTALALQTMRESMFTRAHGDRPLYRNVGIVLTDGESNDRAKTFKEAVANRNKNIEMISIGIGLKSALGQREIRGIANDPDNKNVINVNSFDGLSAVIPSIVQSVCNTVNECDSNPCQMGGTCVDMMNGYRCKCPNGRTGIHCERQCDGKSDIVIAIDASGSIRENRFIMVLDYVKTVVNSLEVAEDRARVGLIVFSDRATVMFHMNTYKTKQDILQAIEMIRYIRGRTNIADTLKKMRTEMFTSAHGDREDVPNYAILITDGESTVNRERTLPEAVETRIAGVILTVVVVGHRTASLEIKGIASDPDDRHVMSVENYKELKNIVEKTIGNTCDAENECALNPCRNSGRCINMHGQFYCKCSNEYTGHTCERRCLARSDVVFILDASGSVESSYAIAQEITRRIVDGLNFDGGRTRVGVVTYSESAKIRFHLNAYTDKTSVLNAISYTLQNRKTNTMSGIDKARYDMFTSNRGDRAGDQNYAVVITDGNSNVNRDRTLSAAKEARGAGIKMIAIGVGENGKVDRSEINDIANDPDNQFAFMLDNNNRLDEVANKVLDQLCQ